MVHYEKGSTFFLYINFISKNEVSLPPISCGGWGDPHYHRLYSYSSSLFLVLNNLANFIVLMVLLLIFKADVFMT